MCCGPVAVIYWVLLLEVAQRKSKQNFSLGVPSCDGSVLTLALIFCHAVKGGRWSSTWTWASGAVDSLWLNCCEHLESSPSTWVVRGHRYMHVHGAGSWNAKAFLQRERIPVQPRLVIVAQYLWSNSLLKSISLKSEIPWWCETSLAVVPLGAVLVRAQRKLWVMFYCFLLLWISVSPDRWLLKFALLSASCGSLKGFDVNSILMNYYFFFKKQCFYLPHDTVC